MALTFPTSKWAYLANATWLDDVSAFSLAGWARFDTITTANKQFVFSHRGPTDKASLRKDSTTDNWKFSVTAGGVNKLVDAGPDPVAGTVYHVACTWQKNNATGMKLYIDGTAIGTTDTTTQTANYDGAGSAPFIFCSETDTGSNFGVCTIEGWSVWPGVVLTQAQVTQHRLNAWPGMLARSAPAQFYSFLNGATDARDWSGNGRHLTSIPSGVTATTSPIAKWERPTRVQGATSVGATTTSPPAENVWIRWPTAIPHPTQVGQLTGLTDGTAYEIRVIAVDQVGNESAPSAVVNATPTGAAVVHHARKKLIPG